MMLGLLRVWERRQWGSHHSCPCVTGSRGSDGIMSPECAGWCALLRGISAAKLEDGDAESGDLPSAGRIDDTHGRPLGGGIRRPTDPWARHSRNRGPRTPNPRPDTALRSCAARLQPWWEPRKGMLVVWGWPSRRSVGVGRWVAPVPRCHSVCGAKSAFGGAPALWADVNLDSVRCLSGAQGPRQKRQLWRPAMPNATLICSALHQARHGRRRWDRDGAWHRRIICSPGRRLSNWRLQPDMGQWKMANDIEDQSWPCERGGVGA